MAGYNYSSSKVATEFGRDVTLWAQGRIVWVRGGASSICRGTLEIEF